MDDGVVATPDDAEDLLRALTAARLAADLLAAAQLRCDRPDLDVTAVVRALEIAVDRAGAAAERLLAPGRPPGPGPLTASAA